MDKATKDEAGDEAAPEGTPKTTARDQGSIAGLTIIKASAKTDNPANGTFLTLYGQGGAGKTTLAASAADAAEGAPYLHIDAEGGKESIEHKSNVEVVEVFNYRDFDKLVAQLKRGPKYHGFKTICVDNLCEIINLSLQQITHSGTDAPEIQEWGAMTREILFKTREFRDMARKDGVNVIFCAWDADEKDDRGVIKKDLAFTPALRREYPGIVTVVGHVAVTSDPNIRKLDFAPGPRTVAKFRRTPTANAMKIPFEIYYGVKNPPLPDILRVMKGGGEWPEARYPKPSRNNNQT